MVSSPNLKKLPLALSAVGTLWSSLAGIPDQDGIGWTVPIALLTVLCLLAVPRLGSRLRTPSLFAASAVVVSLAGLGAAIGYLQPYHWRIVAPAVTDGTANAPLHDGFLASCDRPRSGAVSELRRMTASMLRHGAAISCAGLPDRSLLAAAELEVRKPHTPMPWQVLDLAASRFRALPTTECSEADWLSNVDTGLHQKTVHVALGACDAFVSHS